MFSVIMYHHINSDDLPLSNSDTMMGAHLAYISEHFTTLFPGDPITSDSICLTFDDAYYDFYHYVFPLLKKYKLKALLAVPSAYILEDTDIPPERRLSLKHHEIYKADNYKTYAPFCTYMELREMIQSGHVVVASHSMNHLNLSEKGADLENEIFSSKVALEENLGVRVESFVLPYGKYNNAVVALAREHYPYVFRIGNAFNSSWEGIGGLLYRIKGDALSTPDSLFRPLKQAGFWFKTIVKMVKGS
ncbi:MAG: polysaccharide deacetylase family protein [Sulfuricurvum sp.]|uniref:polysaccharide deacetylase family protein n=1 Tax=Sulfuricurvum sp. TaxID=2025608 RepID=UPI0027360106|nr:polysaccharide deacetylase family protein [Sulfuricurvum sp.]MDP3291874.1 polysaccharide deacetylase family protein [Sulfuricurvum sp.]